MSPGPSTRRPPGRRGATLLVVLSMLALFAVVGLSFVLYAESRANAARVRKEALSRGPAAVPPADLADSARGYAERFLGQLLFDVPDTDTTLTRSGVRGHSLARTKYGWNATTPTAMLSPFNGDGLVTDATPIAAGLPARADVTNFAVVADPVVDPEWDGTRTVGGLATAPATTFTNVSAAYTYPDRKDLYLAVVDPQAALAVVDPQAAVDGTRRLVLQPSFHRYGDEPPATVPAWVFNRNNNDPLRRLAPPSVVAANTDWTNAEGRYKIVRPRPADHRFDPDGAGSQPETEEFPYPPPNADGTYTGDVQNLPGGPGVQRNDSVWVYPAGPVREFNGRRYTALVAPLIVDLGGRVNLSTAGNLLAQASGVREADGVGAEHASHHGLGPWEVNPRWVFAPGQTVRTALPADDALLYVGTEFPLADTTRTVRGRYGRQPTIATAAVPADTVTGANHVAFADSAIPPSFARVDVDGAGTGPGAIPVGGTTSPFPDFPAARYYSDATSRDAELQNHPAQRRPGYADTTFPAADLRWLGTRVSGPAEDFAKAELAKLLPDRLIAGPNASGADRYLDTLSPFSPVTYPGFADTTVYNADLRSGVVADTAALVRLLTTPVSNSTHRPEVTFTGRDALGAAVTVRLGPVDLSAPLPDYRGAGPFPDGSTYTPIQLQTGGTVAAADAARRRLARDVHVRLLALIRKPDGTSVLDNTNILYDAGVSAVRVEPSLTGAAKATAENLVRSTAQLAVNVVDYIDPDDIATVYVWNRSAATTDPTDPATWAGPPAVTAAMTVAGTELPRLVINEGYAAVTAGANVTVDPMRTQFWVELHNPLSADPNLSLSGAAKLHYTAADLAGVTLPPALASSGYSPYQLVITNPTNLTDANASPGDLTAAGALPIGKSIVIGRFGQNDYVQAPAALPAAPTQVPPAEFYVVGPQPQPASTTLVDVSPTLVRDQSAIAPARMIIDTDPPGRTEGDITATLTVAPYAAILRRLANPYRPPQFDPTAADYNPYVTTDVFDMPNPADRVEPNGTTPARTTGPTVDSGTSGRRHPYARNLTQRQNQGAGVTYPTPAPHSFAAANSDTDPAGTATDYTLDTPLRWLAHLDRPPLNPLELVGVSAVPPHLLTDLFAIAAGQYHRHTAERWLLPGMQFGGDARGYTIRPDRPPFTATQVNAAIVAAGTPDVVNDASADYKPGFLHPALDLLAVRTPNGPPVGAPSPGRLNLNAVWHPSVLRALFDPNPANFFRPEDVFQDPPPPPPEASFWQRLTEDVTEYTGPNPPSLGKFVRSPSFPDVSANDQPIRALLSNATSPQATVLRRPNGDPAKPPLLYPDLAAAPYPNDEARNHAFAQTEALRKAWNNMATTSDTFLVVMTVGFFEVRHQDANGRVFLGRELYDLTPGDQRVKFMAVVDRSHLALEVDTTATPPTPLPAGRPHPFQDSATPWFTVAQTEVQARPFVTGDTPQTVDIEGKFDNTPDPDEAVVFANGAEVRLKENSVIRLGYGDAALNNGEGQQYTVTAVTQVTGSNSTVRLAIRPPATNAAGTTFQNYRSHPAGAVVTNVLLGNPGPQPRFTLNPFDPEHRRYKTLVPVFARLPR